MCTRERVQGIMGMTEGTVLSELQAGKENVIEPSGLNSLLNFREQRDYKQQEECVAPGLVS